MTALEFVGATALYLAAGWGLGRVLVATEDDPTAHGQLFIRAVARWAILAWPLVAMLLVIAVLAIGVDALRRKVGR